MAILAVFDSLYIHPIHSIVASTLNKTYKLDITLFAFTWHHSFYLESSDGSCLGNIPITGSIDMDVGELRWFGIFHGPQGLTLYDQRKHVLGPLPGLAYLH